MITIIVIFGLLIFLAIAGIPVAFAFLAASAVGLFVALGDLDAALSVLQQTAFGGVKTYTFVVLPLFTIMGLVIGHCGAAKDLFNIVNRRLSGVPGRLAVATVGGNAIFAAVTGVGIASAAAFSHIAYPAMRSFNYQRSFALGAIAGSSVLGLLIPPSVFMIVWALLTEQSIGKLFIAGVIPGLLLALLYAVYAITAAAVRPDWAPRVDSEDAPNDDDSAVRRSELIGGAGVIVLIFVVIGGIWMGIFTPTEASAFGVVGAVILGVLKGMRYAELSNAFLEAGKTVAPILMLIIGAKAYSRLLALEGIPIMVQDGLEATGLGPIGILWLMVVVWIVLGMMIDSVSIMLLTVPIFWPIAQALGFDPIVFALVGILVIEAGVLTPPFGLAAFVVKAAVPDPEVTIRDVFAGSFPYCLMILLVAWLVFMIPGLATWLPSLM